MFLLRPYSTMKFIYDSYFFRRKFFVFSCIVFSGLFYLIVWSHLLASDDMSPMEAWEGASRNVSDYVSETLKPHLVPKRFCEANEVLVVIVCSRPDGFDIRRAIRETWGQTHDVNASVFFLIGEVGKNYILQDKIEAESTQHGDIIQERFVDTYYNLTLKSVHMLKLFKDYCSTTHKYLMKADDDLFVNLRPIVAFLAQQKYHDDVLLGRKKTQIHPYRTPSSKWHMPYEWFPYDTYPDFLCGPGYIMSADVVKKVFECAMEVPLLHLEDVYLTGICSNYLKIEPINSYKFTCNIDENNVCEDWNAWTFHYLSAKAIRETYDILKNNRCDKSRKYNVVQEWIFFLDLR